MRGLRVGVGAGHVPCLPRGGVELQHISLTVVAVALLFGVVYCLIKPVVKFFSFALFILTLGLFTFIVNALML
ncbi:phage holin family protein, partial [Streptomyces sp. BE303]|uniref:phage holin family protein n=1 Tax=Streptomyces sp. BE303 TaxID=3002528 RepID=UPI003FA6DD52